MTGAKYIRVVIVNIVRIIQRSDRSVTLEGLFAYLKGLALSVAGTCLLCRAGAAEEFVRPGGESELAHLKI